jgi:hypothetical protein
MMVAWHEVPGKEQRMISSRRDGMIDRLQGPSNLGRCTNGANQLTPFPTGRIISVDRSRHFVPGYLHSVPPGQD